MADRTVYGLTHSENGWRMVDQGSCVWVKVPGTSVTLQIREGQPAKIMGAFAADFNAYVEPLRDADSACWTPTNSVASSNHLSGTGMDLNWNGPDGKTFRLGIPESVAYPGDKSRNLRELLDFYEGMIFCGGFWSIQDWMHMQMGANTYGSQNVEKVNDFIRRKIRPDGFSTFRRGTPAPTSNAADVLAEVMGNAVSKELYTALVPAVADCLRKSDCTNFNRVAMWCAQIGHESVGLKYMKEIGDAAYFAKYNNRSDLGNGPTDGPRYPGRGPIQVTGRHNYRKLSEWAYSKGYVPTPTFFEDSPEQLERLEYAFLGAIWYWTVARPDINALSDKRDLLTVTQRINGGTNGLSDRQTRYNRALAMGDRLLALLDGGDDLTPEQDKMLREVHACLFNKVPSQSLYADPNEGNKWRLHELIKNQDGLGHEAFVEREAARGNQDELERVVRVAQGQGRVREQWAIDRARRVLAEIEAKSPEILQRYLAQKGLA